MVGKEGVVDAGDAAAGFRVGSAARTARDTGDASRQPGAPLVSLHLDVARRAGETGAARLVNTERTRHTGAA